MKKPYFITLLCCALSLLAGFLLGRHTAPDGEHQPGETLHTENAEPLGDQRRQRIVRKQSGSAVTPSPAPVPENAFPERPVHPFAGDYDEYLKQTQRSPESLAWVFTKTGDVSLLKEALAKYPDNSFLRFIAAASKSLDEETSRESSAWLEKNEPLLHVILELRRTEGKITPSQLRRLADGKLTFLPDNILTRQHEDFLIGVKGESIRDAIRNAVGNTEFSVRSIVTVYGWVSPDPSVKLAAGAIGAEGRDLTFAGTGLTNQRICCMDMTESDLQALRGQSRQQALAEISGEFAQILSLRKFREQFISGASEDKLAQYRTLRDSVGEKEALKTLKAQTPGE